MRSDYMNFNPTIPYQTNMYPQPIDLNNLIYRVEEFEKRLKYLEDRITKLENKTKLNNPEPDNSMYML